MFNNTVRLTLVHPTLTQGDVAKTCEAIRDVGRAALA